MVAIKLFLLIGVLWLLVRLFQDGPVWGRITVLAVGGAAGLALSVRYAWAQIRHRGWRPRWRVRQLRGQLAKAGREPRHVLAVCPFGERFVPFGYVAGTSFRDIIYLVYEELPAARTSLEIWRRSGRVFVHDRSIDMSRLRRVTVEAGEVTGSWLLGSVIEVSFDDHAQPFTLLAPGNQPDLLTLPWRLQEVVRRRRRISEARERRRLRRRQPES